MKKNKIRNINKKYFIFKKNLLKYKRNKILNIKPIK